MCRALLATEHQNNVSGQTSKHRAAQPPPYELQSRLTLLQAALVYKSRAQRLNEQHTQAALIEHLDSHLP